MRPLHGSATSACHYRAYDDVECSTSGSLATPCVCMHPICIQIRKNPWNVRMWRYHWIPCVQYIRAPDEQLIRPDVIPRNRKVPIHESLGFLRVCSLSRLSESRSNQVTSTFPSCSVPPLPRFITEGVPVVSPSSALISRFVHSGVRLNVYCELKSGTAR